MIYQPPFILRGNRIRDNNGLDVAFLTIDPSIPLSEEDIRVGNILASSPQLLDIVDILDRSFYITGPNGTTARIIPDTIMHRARELTTLLIPNQ